MGKPQLSVIIPVRNRAGVRADNCLGSLRWQTLGESDLEIVVSDFGSEPRQRSELAELAEGHAVNLVYTETDELWNRSRALNIGIQAASADLVVCTDIDMIFRPSFMATVAERLAANPRAMVVSRCRDLPEEVPEQPWCVEDFDEHEAKARYRPSSGTGACQGVARSFFFDVRGYDESYVFWGFEDGDMLNRAKRSGLSLSWIHDHTSMLHQWHPHEARKKLHWKYINKARFLLTKHRIRKNPRSWGTIESR